MYYVFIGKFSQKAVLIFIEKSSLNGVQIFIGKFSQKSVLICINNVLTGKFSQKAVLIFHRKVLTECVLISIAAG